MVKESYSLFDFRQEPDEIKVKYLELARGRQVETRSPLLLEVIAANLWAKDMRRKQEGG